MTNIAVVTVRHSRTIIAKNARVNEKQIREALNIVNQQDIDDKINELKLGNTIQIKLPDLKLSYTFNPLFIAD